MAARRPKDEPAEDATEAEETLVERAKEPEIEVVEVVNSIPVLAEGWEAMESAPTYGRPVWLAGLLPFAVPIPVFSPGYYYKSRHWRGSVTRWVEFGEWRVLNAPHAVPFKPTCWCRYE